MEKRLMAGLVSVTYRQLTAGEVIALCVTAGLGGIEWGGDVHVPHGDIETASAVGEMTARAGLRVLSYGSYYRAGMYDDALTAFEGVLACARALGAPNIRLWAGERNSEDMPEAMRRKIAAEVRTLADVAARDGINISFEFHEGTLTNTAASAVRLVEEIGHAGVRLYWQPNRKGQAENIEDLRQILPHLSHVHVHQYDGQYHALADGAAQWQAYLDVIASDGKAHGLMMEFVKDNAPAQLRADAAALKSWIDGLKG